MNEPDRPSGVTPEEWATRKLEAEIAEFQNLVENATVADVDEPTGRKEVEIGYEDGREFIVEEGTAIGVYFQPSRARPSRVHIDWDDERGRTTVKWHNVVDFEESEYYTE